MAFNDRLKCKQKFNLQIFRPFWGQNRILKAQIDPKFQIESSLKWLWNFVFSADSSIAAQIGPLTLLLATLWFDEQQKFEMASPGQDRRRSSGNARGGGGPGSDVHRLS